MTTSRNCWNSTAGRWNNPYCSARPFAETAGELYHLQLHRFSIAAGAGLFHPFVVSQIFRVSPPLQR
jgi:hypothetical protein